jgi:hypothetical protein
MGEFKSILKAAIPASLAKAEKYRLLNDPRNAESICRDVLQADPDNQEALVMLVLALTDQFGKNLRVAVNHAQETLPRITDEYKRTYYGGVICERWAKGQFEQGAPGYVIHDWLIRAQEHYEKAESMAGSDTADPVLRWNAVARILERNKEFRPKPQDQSIEAGFSEEVPFRQAPQ